MNKKLIQAISSSPFAVLPPFVYQNTKIGWNNFKSNGAARIDADKSVVLNAENIGSIAYVIHNDFLSGINYQKISNQELEKTIVLINSNLMSKSILNEDETIVLAMTGHVLTENGMCEIMTSMKVDGILEKGFD